MSENPMMPPSAKPPGVRVPMQASPLGPTPVDPLGLAPTRPGPPQTASAIGNGEQIDKLDAVVAELRELRQEMAERHPTLVSIQYMLSWAFAIALIWAVLVGGCRQVVESQRYQDLQRAFDRGF